MKDSLRKKLLSFSVFCIWIVMIYTFINDWVFVKLDFWYIVLKIVQSAQIFVLAIYLLPILFPLDTYGDTPYSLTIARTITGLVIAATIVNLILRSTNLQTEKNKKLYTKIGAIFQIIVVTVLSTALLSQ